MKPEWPLAPPSKNCDSIRARAASFFSTTESIETTMSGAGPKGADTAGGPFAVIRMRAETNDPQLAVGSWRLAVGCLRKDGARKAQEKRCAQSRFQERAARLAVVQGRASR